MRPVAEHERRCAAKFFVVGQHERRLKTLSVAGEPACGGVTGVQGRHRGLAGGGTGCDREVDALQPDPRGQAHRGRVPGDQHAVADQSRHGVVAALGDEVRAVLDQFAAFDQRMDRRVGLELGDDLLGTPAGGGEVG